MIVAGVGCSLGCSAEELLALVDACLVEAGLEHESVGTLATVDRRREEPGVVGAAQSRGWPLRTFAVTELAAVPVPTPSEVVVAHVGTPSVAEAAALLAAPGGALVLAKRRSANATCALASVTAASGALPGLTPHPIEVESYRILRSRVDLSHLAPLSRAVTERVVHASADLSFADSLVLDESALQRGHAALDGGATIVCDARMAAAGITCRKALVPLDDPRTAERAQRDGTTRSGAAMRIAVEEVGPGAVWVIGNAPTALRALLECPPHDPALIVGLPVGFVGAADAKAALTASGLPCATNVGERGGSAVAVAAVNALLYAR